MNELLLPLEILLTFSTLILSYKAFGKEGLFVWISVALVLANITTAKTVELFGLTVDLGTVLFASTFLASDILTEKYGEKVARKAVYIGIGAAVFFVGATQLALAYIPASSDFITPAMTDLFTMDIRVTASSIVCCLLANLVDIWIYSKIKKATSGRFVWLRNNVATIISNCGENFLFIFLAFIGIFTVQECLVLAATTCVIEMLVAFCDTPFLYLSRKVKPREISDENNEALLLAA